jgi:spermidine/putrescine transport system substrate-binding protein
MSQRIGRRDLFRYAGMGLGVSAVLAACKKAEEAGGPVSSGATRPPVGQEPGDLQVFDWAGYGDGYYYPKREQENFWQAYADQTGDTPKFTTFTDDDSGYLKVATGTEHFDIVHPCGYRYQDYVDLGVMQPWDTSLIPNFAKLNPKLEQQGVINGEQYFIPLDWGFIAPLVNSDKVDTSDPSFGILFDERYAGKISWVDTSNMIYVTGIYQGVPDPFDMTDDELQAAKEFLISKKHLVKFYWKISSNMASAFNKGEIWIAYAWPDAVGYADAAGTPYTYMTPKEGRVSWVCGMGLFADSANYYHAHDYVNSWASKKAAEFLLAWYYYGHANTTADLSVVPKGIIDALGLDDPAVLDPPNSIPESYIPRRDVYQSIWEEVKAS